MSERAMGKSAMSEGPTADHAAATVEIFPVPDLPRFAEGDDLATAIAHRAPWLADGDVVVVTSKVISKVEGRMVAAPTDPDQRDRLRRRLIADETVRIVARRGRTLITENRNGLVQAAAGVDGSNVDTDQLALLPLDSDASAANLRAALADRLGVRVAVIITDTMGRAWRTGQTDVAIGASGIAVSHPYDGVVDAYGNTLQVTDIAIADEIAAAADLVKGKLGNLPVAVVRGLAVSDNGSRATDLVRSGEQDMFFLGTTEAIDTGRLQALRTRTSVREFVNAPVPDDDMYAAFGDALTAPSPHHTRPVRFVWVRDADRRRRLLGAMADQWRTDLRADGLGDDAIERRVARGDILYRAPELVIPVMVPDGAHSYPDDRRTAAEHTMFTVAVGAAVQGLLVALSVRGIGSCWIGSTIFAPEIARDILNLGELGPQTYPLGAIAIGYPDRLTGLRPAATTDGLVVQR